MPFSSSVGQFSGCYSSSSHTRAQRYCACSLRRKSGISSKCKTKWTWAPPFTARSTSFNAPLCVSMGWCTQTGRKARTGLIAMSTGLLLMTFKDMGWWSQWHTLLLMRWCCFSSTSRVRTIRSSGITLWPLLGRSSLSTSEASFSRSITSATLQRSQTWTWTWLNSVSKWKSPDCFTWSTAVY